MDADVLWRIGYTYCRDFGKNVSSLDMIILLNSIVCQTNFSRENAFFEVSKKLFTKDHWINFGLFLPDIKRLNIVNGRNRLRDL